MWIADRCWCCRWPNRRYLGAPKPLAKRIDGYFEYLTMYSHPGPDGMALIGQLPSSMHQDIAVWMYKDLVNKVG